MQRNEPYFRVGYVTKIKVVQTSQDLKFQKNLTRSYPRRGLHNTKFIGRTNFNFMLKTT